MEKNTNPESPVEMILEEEQPPKTIWPKVGLVVGFLVIFAAGLALGWYITQMPKEPLTPDDETPQLPISDDTVEEEDGDDDEEPGELTINTDPDTLTIDWLPVDDQYPVDSEWELTEIMFGENQYISSELGAGPKTYQLGTVVGGKYDGYDLRHYLAGLQGMGTFITDFYILVPEDYEAQRVVLTNYSTSGHVSGFAYPNSYSQLEDILYGDLYEQITTKYIIETALTVPGLEVATSSVQDTSGNNLDLIGIWFRVDYPYEVSESNYDVVTTLNDGTVLREYVYDEDFGVELHSATNALFHTRDDGRLVFYNVEVPFWTDPYSGQKSQPALITWDDGSANDNEYTKTSIGGCGPTDVIRVVDDPVIINGLVSAGTFSVSGQSGTIFEPSSYDTDYYRESYDTWGQHLGLDSFEDYIVDHPYIYWQDPFGRWIEFMGSEIMPAVECGKPVIYLYPEEEMEIEIEIELENMSVSEPEYNDGWQVLARPDGSLVNLEDGASYPYLFWEGTGEMYSAPENYWVVAASDVESFLNGTLAEFGLNAQETADFMEFWYPLMQDAPYYQIGFHGTQIMDQLAPLTYSERPDSVLRILMDYTELDSSIEANPPSYLPSFERNGFTVVEWGGVLR